MEKLIDFLGCGLYHSYSHRDAAMFFVSNFSDIINKIIPFFEKYPMLGVKAKDFGDFKKVSVMMQDKHHLTSSGLEQIRQIKSGMNKGRK
jgi:LAGLIDADG endonuclease